MYFPIGDREMEGGRERERCHIYPPRPPWIHLLSRQASFLLISIVVVIKVILGKRQQARVSWETPHCMCVGERGRDREREAWTSATITAQPSCLHTVTLPGSLNTVGFTTPSRVLCLYHRHTHTQSCWQLSNIHLPTGVQVINQTKQLTQHFTDQECRREGKKKTHNKSTKKIEEEMQWLQNKQVLLNKELRSWGAQKTGKWLK